MWWHRQIGSWRVATVHIVPRGKFGDLWWKHKRRRTKFGSYHLDNLSDSSPLNALKIFLFISDLETKAGILLWKESWKESFTSGDRVCEWPTIRKTTTITTTATTTTTTTITIPSQRIGSHRCNTIVNPLKRWIIFCLTSWIFLFSDFKYSTRVICIYAVSFIGIYMVSLCRKTNGKNNFFSFYSTESLIFYNHYWVKTTRIRSVLAVLVSTAWLKRCFPILLHVLFFFWSPYFIECGAGVCKA